MLKGIMEAQDLLQKVSDPEIVEVASSDITDDEAANVYVKNMKDTGTRPKYVLKCRVCDFVAKNEQLLREWSAQLKEWIQVQQMW